MVAALKLKLKAYATEWCLPRRQLLKFQAVASAPACWAARFSVSCARHALRFSAKNLFMTLRFADSDARVSAAGFFLEEAFACHLVC